MAELMGGSSALHRRSKSGGNGNGTSLTLFLLDLPNKVEHNLPLEVSVRLGLTHHTHFPNKNGGYFRASKSATSLE
jgi:hypothetical protein